MHNFDLILTLAAGLIAALALGYLTERLGWSPIVGYLLAGILSGPHTPGFVADNRLASQLAEIGIVLLMFGVGLHFRLSDLRAVKRIALAGAICQSAIATLVGALVARLFGWDWSSGVVYGLALSVASTVVLTRLLSEAGQLQSPMGRIAVGWLVMEDIFTVFVLVLLPVVFRGPAGNSAAGIFLAFAVAAAKLAVFVAFTLLAGGRFIPWLLGRIANTRSRELFTLSILAVALGIAVGAAHLFGVSMALGAFLAGMVVGQSDFSARAAAEALPMRDAFAVMFFVSVGMLFDPRRAVETPALIFATLGVVLIAKPIAAFAMAVLLGYGSRIGFGVAIALAQIGEFSFLLAAVGTQLGALPESAMNPLVAAAIVSIMLNPLLYKTLAPLDAALARLPRLWRFLNRHAASRLPAEVPEDAASFSHRAVLVGYGPVGQAVARLLLERGIDTAIVEMNIETHRRLRREGHRAVFGDANQREVLEQAGIAGAASLILSTGASAGAVEAIRSAREINPGIHVVSRADYLGQVASLRSAGADEVFTGEAEVALAMTASILRQLGATPEQLDRESERIRAELSRPG